MSVRRVDGNEGREEAVSVQRQRLREIIGDVPSSGKMPHQELALRDSVDQSVQPHVASFGQLGLDGFVGDADSDFVVAVQERRRLRVAKVGEGLAFGDGRPGGAEGAGPFGLLDAGADDWNTRGGDRDWSVDK